MTTKSHYFFGLHLLDTEFYSAERRKRAAFLWGCIEPDLNPGTYLKGSLHGQKLRGHNFPNMLPCIHRLFQETQRRDHAGVLYFYRLGKLAHYLTDAFTYPHNAVFHGSLKDHVNYEAELEPLFLQQLFRSRKIWKTDGFTDLYQLFLKAHQEYLHSQMEKERDLAFALQVVSGIIHARASQTLSMQTPFYEEVPYENPAHI